MNHSEKQKNPFKDIVDHSNESDSEYHSEIEILDHVDLSFLMNHSLDELEAEFTDNNEDEAISEEEFEPDFLNIEQDGLQEEDTSSSENIDEPLEKSENIQDNSNENQLIKNEFLGILSKSDGNDLETLETSSSENRVEPTELPEDKWDDQLLEETEGGLEVKEEPNITENDEIKQKPYFSSSKESKLGLLKRQNTYQIGLDIGTRSVKYVITKKQKKKAQIVGFGVFPNNFEKGKEFDEIIEYLFDELQLKTQYPQLRSACNVYGTKVGVKRNSLPPMKAKMMQEAIYWSAKKEFDLQEVPAQVDYCHLGKIEKKGMNYEDLLVIGCEEEIISEKTEPCLAKNILPFKVTPLTITIWKLYQNSSVFNDEGVVALVDIGESKTTIAFINKGVLEFSREIPTGGKDITESLTGTIFYDGKPYQLDYEQAESLKLKYGFPSDELDDQTEQGAPIKEYSVLMRPVLERLANEIQRSIDYLREKFVDQPLDHIYLLGGSSQLKNLIPFFSEFIEPELDILPSPKELPNDLNEQDLSVLEGRFRELANAYSLATDYDKRLNLLPKSLQRLDKFKSVRRFTIYGIFIGLMLIGMATGFSFLRSVSLSNQFQVLKLRYERLAPLKQQYDDLQQMQQYLQNKKSIYKKELILDNPLPNALKIVANLFPKDMAVIDIHIVQKNSQEARLAGSQRKKAKKDKKTVQGRVIKLHGIYNHPSPDAGIDIANYVSKLKKTGFFRTIHVNHQKYVKEYDRLQFEIVGELKQ